MKAHPNYTVKDIYVLENTIKDVPVPKEDAPNRESGELSDKVCKHNDKQECEMKPDIYVNSSGKQDKYKTTREIIKEHNSIHPFDIHIVNRNNDNLWISKEEHEKEIKIIDEAHTINYNLLLDHIKDLEKRNQDLRGNQ